MSEQYYTIAFTGTVIIKAEDEFDLGMKFRELMYALPVDMDLNEDSIEVVDE